MTGPRTDSVLIVAPGQAAESPGVATVLAAAHEARVAAETLLPASENDLRRRLAAGGIGFVYFIGQGKARAAAGHATLDFDGAAGPASRAVNLRHLAGLLAGAGGPALVLLQPLAPTGDFRGLAPALVQGGVGAAVVWPPAPTVPLFGVALRRLFERWRDGAPVAELAAAASVPEGVEWAGSMAVGAVAAGPFVAAPAAPPAAIAAAAATASAAEAAPAYSPAQLRLQAKRASGRFDVFLCHNSADKPAVRALARALKERGILPWLDEAELPPGQPWQALLEQQMASIGCAAVCVGRAGVGPWQEQELYGFLREFVARRAPVIPVLLPDAPSAPELPLFLRAMTYVDFRLRDLDPMARLEWGITGVRPADD